MKIQFYCSAYPMRPKNGYATRSIPRFYVKTGKRIIWDYPKDFKVDPKSSEWCDHNGISDIVREYIDTPLSEILKKDFGAAIKDKERAHVARTLTNLFKCIDRRISKSTRLKLTLVRTV